jgi:hypothetical protein
LIIGNNLTMLVMKALFSSNRNEEILRQQSFELANRVELSIIIKARNRFGKIIAHKKYERQLLKKGV